MSRFKRGDLVNFDGRQHRVLTVVEAPAGFFCWIHTVPGRGVGRWVPEASLVRS